MKSNAENPNHHDPRAGARARTHTRMPYTKLTPKEENMLGGAIMRIVFILGQDCWSLEDLEDLDETARVIRSLLKGHIRVEKAPPLNLRLSE